jgi:hypothetical protein
MLERRYLLKYVVIDECIIIKLILKKYDMDLINMAQDRGSW